MLSLAIIEQIKKKSGLDFSNATGIYFSNSFFDVDGQAGKSAGRSVRLVRDVDEGVRM